MAEQNAEGSREDLEFLRDQSELGKVRKLSMKINFLFNAHPFSSTPECSTECIPEEISGYQPGGSKCELQHHVRMKDSSMN